MFSLNPVLWVTGYFGRLRYPVLLTLTAGAFLLDLFIPDLLPFADEVLLGLLTAVFASLRRRRAGEEPKKSGDAGRAG
jgi:hypothetical protein